VVYRIGQGIISLGDEQIFCLNPEELKNNRSFAGYDPEKYGQIRNFAGSSFTKFYKIRTILGILQGKKLILSDFLPCKVN